MNFLERRKARRRARKLGEAYLNDHPEATEQELQRHIAGEMEKEGFDPFTLMTIILAIIKLIMELRRKN